MRSKVTVIKGKTLWEKGFKSGFEFKCIYLSSNSCLNSCYYQPLRETGSDNENCLQFRKNYNFFQF